MYIYSHIFELLNQLTVFFSDYDNFSPDQLLFAKRHNTSNQSCEAMADLTWPKQHITYKMYDKMDDSDIVLGQNEIAVAHIVRSILTSDCSRLLWKRAQVPLLKFAHQF